LMLFGFGSAVLVTEAGIHLTHALFIGTFTSMALLVGTRVLQSHGGQVKELENSPVLYLTMALTTSAMLVRVSAFYLADHYATLLGLSALLLMGAVIAWSLKFLPQILLFPQD
ncbi:MAG: hypothetical protein HN509_03980, partial [Halobacteriovoraceae bacterium]|nr:hypothetical protein [Halobacteriovoraceae bacterium]